MKNKIALVLTALLLILSGCRIFGESLPDSSSAVSLSSQDSIVKFNIYPENNSFSTVEKFDREGYKSLNEKQKSLYILFDNAIFAMQTGYIGIGDATQYDINLVYMALRTDRPEYFWLPTSYVLRTTGDRQEICFAKEKSDWLYSEQQREEYETEIKQTLETMFKTLSGSESEFERELIAHDTLINNITYEDIALDDYDRHVYAWNIVGGLLKGKAVCEGYSKAMQVVSYMLGLNCSVITGVFEEPHMWNVININNRWYHLDLTADDGKNKIYHFFFNVTTEYILKSRTIDPLTQNTANISAGNVFIPKCSSTEDNYHVVNSLYIAEKEQVESTVVSIICDAKRSGKNQVEFAVSPEMQFVFGQKDAAEAFNLEKCISIANAELGSKNRIKYYYYGGIEGALGFMISW